MMQIPADSNSSIQPPRHQSIKVHKENLVFSLSLSVFVANIDNQRYLCSERSTII